MKFRKGNLVEVLRREHESRGSWFPAIVVSACGNYCKIRYESLSDNNGEHVMEKEHREGVRHQDCKAQPVVFFTGEGSYRTSRRILPDNR